MASVSHGKDGRWTVQYVDGDGKRQTITLGKVPGRDLDAKRIRVEAIKSHVEQLVYAATRGHPADSETVRWVARLTGKPADRLAKLGLIAARVTVKPVLLGEFLDGVIAGRKADVKPATLELFGCVRRNLVDYFGADRDLASIGPGEAAAFRAWLSEHEHLARNTVARRIGFARQFFKVAQGRKLVADNAFAGVGMSTVVRADPSKFHYVTRQDADAILAACPGVQWRLVFSLARYGGLRPSEILLLRWADVLWDRLRLTVHSPKTEHHEGKGERVIPMFPELQVHLLEAFNQAPEGSEYVVDRPYAGRNMRTGLAAIIRKAGLPVWCKLFVNLRSSRQTELSQAFPLHVVCGWIGNSQPIAMKHYLQITDSDFDRACAAQALQQVNADSCNGVKIVRNETRDGENCSYLHAVATPYNGVKGATVVQG